MVLCSNGCSPQREEEEGGGGEYILSLHTRVVSVTLLTVPLSSPAQGGHFTRSHLDILLLSLGRNFHSVASCLWW